MRPNTRCPHKMREYDVSVRHCYVSHLRVAMNGTTRSTRDCIRAQFTPETREVRTAWLFNRSDATKQLKVWRRMAPTAESIPYYYYALRLSDGGGSGGERRRLGARRRRLPSAGGYSRTVAAGIYAHTLVRGRSLCRWPWKKIVYVALYTLSYSLTYSLTYTHLLNLRAE